MNEPARRADIDASVARRLFLDHFRDSDSRNQSVGLTPPDALEGREGLAALAIRAAELAGAPPAWARAVGVLVGQQHAV